MFKNTFLLDEKTALAGISEKSKTIVANSSDKSFNRLLYNLNNGFHKQEKKFEVKNNLLKKQTFSSGFRNGFHYPGWRTPWKISETMEENGFHYLENEFPLARMRSVFTK